MKLRITLSIAIVLTLVTACEEVIDRPALSQDTQKLVVEAILTNEKTNHLIKLTHTYASQNGTPVPATGAVVRVIEGTTTYLVTENPAGSGLYYTQVMTAVFGKTYTLDIQYQGLEYIAQDSSVPVEPLNALSYKKANDLYTLNLNQSGNSAYFIDHSIAWKNTSACTAGASCDGRIVFYDLKTIDVNEIYKPSKEDFDFPLGTTVIRKKYSVSPAFQQFLRSVLSETEWRGGLFDVQRANANTNLSGGAIGFFAVSTVVGDTTVVK